MAQADDSIAQDDDRRVHIEIWIAMNEEGAYEVGNDQEEAATRLVEKQGGCQVRTAVLTVKMAPPQYTSTTAQVPDDVGHIVVIDTATDYARCATINSPD